MRTDRQLKALLAFRFVSLIVLLGFFLFAVLGNAQSNPAPKCKSGKTNCKGRCVNLNKDVLHCGACDKSCQTGEKCSKGQCQDVLLRGPNPSPPAKTAPHAGQCPGGQEWCQGRCVDSTVFLSDSSNCGRCGNSCAIMSETCRGGSCSCAPGYTTCMGRCVSDSSFSSDTSNCGSCGRQCSIGESCMGGTCMRTTPCRPGDIGCH